MPTDNRSTILAFVPYYLPGYKSGGPIRSIANKVDRLGDRFDFRIVTSDRDATDASSYDGVKSDAWTQVGQAKVFYSSPAGRSFAALYRLLNTVPYDVLYLNSVFFYDYTLKPLFLRRLGLLPHRPVVLASRGEFSRGALALKTTKKRAFLALARAVGLYSGVTWQATSAYEADDIRREMGRATHVRIAPTLAPEHGAADVERVPKAPGTLRLLFLSRISPKKNLHLALKMLSEVQVQVSYTIVGPVRDDVYWARCKELMDELPPHVEAKYKGPIPYEQVLDEMAAHDLFFMPTAGENYGHVIQEALAAGTPVLISDQTPWRNLEEHSVGWDLSLEQPARFRRVIEACARKAPEAYQAWREHIASWQARFQEEDEPCARNAELFEGVLDRP